MIQTIKTKSMYVHALSKSLCNSNNNNNSGSLFTQQNSWRPCFELEFVHNSEKLSLNNIYETQLNSTTKTVLILPVYPRKLQGDIEFETIWPFRKQYAGDTRSLWPKAVSRWHRQWGPLSLAPEFYVYLRFSTYSVHDSLHFVQAMLWNRTR